MRAVFKSAFVQQEGSFRAMLDKTILKKETRREYENELKQKKADDEAKAKAEAEAKALRDRTEAAKKSGFFSQLLG